MVKPNDAIALIISLHIIIGIIVSYCIRRLFPRRWPPSSGYKTPSIDSLNEEGNIGLPPVGGNINVMPPLAPQGNINVQPPPAAGAAVNVRPNGGGNQGAVNVRPGGRGGAVNVRPGGRGAINVQR